ncbi:hypothetical protein HYPSUDRAFT_203291 [Hypholoma sublateritium FD-334 SS-4]|uniref:Uncharacterized protein n=1 Tax=Hypholoma sublateritium (strain FD-334 SS-4) TaxID=945553 RepID=A0A0D2MCF4_HYPSF|nr:hypothetical protein HYPSUDRAFT_203291 [Hypholoma sublateritium FD-334 SS-4]
MHTSPLFLLPHAASGLLTPTDCAPSASDIANISSVDAEVAHKVQTFARGLLRSLLTPSPQILRNLVARAAATAVLHVRHAIRIRAAARVAADSQPARPIASYMTSSSWLSDAAALRTSITMTALPFLQAKYWAKLQRLKLAYSMPLAFARDMPDPNGLYSKFFEKQLGLSNILVNPPPILGQNQDVIKSQRYGERPAHLAPVSLEVYAPPFPPSLQIVKLAHPYAARKSAFAHAGLKLAAFAIVHDGGVLADNAQCISALPLHFKIKATLAVSADAHALFLPPSPHPSVPRSSHRCKVPRPRLRSQVAEINLTLLRSCTSAPRLDPPLRIHRSFLRKRMNGDKIMGANAGGEARYALLGLAFQGSYAQKNKALVHAIITAHNGMIAHSQLIYFPDVAFFTSPIPPHIIVVAILYGHISYADCLPPPVALDMIPRLCKQ